MSIKNIFKRVLLILGILVVISISIDLVGLLVASLTLQNMARQGARYAATGEFNLAYCHDLDADDSLCSGKSRYEEIKIARLGSIHHIVDIQKGLLLINADATWNQPSYLRVVVCPNNIIKQPKAYTGPKAIVDLPSQGGFSAESYSHCTLDGREGEDPSYDVSSYRDPNHYGVVVMVDYNYPFFCPLFRIFGSYYHLTATAEGVIEKYR